MSTTKKKPEKRPLKGPKQGFKDALKRHPLAILSSIMAFGTVVSVSCSPQGFVVFNPCTSEDTADALIVRCNENMSIIPKPYGVVVGTFNATPLQCPAGGIGVVTGQDLNRNGVLDGAEAISTNLICNGLQSTTTTITEIVDPCGTQSGHDEVLLRLSSGQILASFSDSVGGDNTRFSVLGPGNYMTTDGTHCNFTLTSDGDLLNEHN